jgi:hypothetical protein
MAHPSYQGLSFPLSRYPEEPDTALESAELVAISPPSLCYAVAAARSQEQLATNDVDLDAFLNQVVEQAQVITGACGAAVALRQGRVVLCRARCGETGPRLGAQLDNDSGISGECLRTGRGLRCEDAHRDIRVDPAVCGQLGLRSIAVIPILGIGSTRAEGILEVFSRQPRAFDEWHLEILKQLGQLVTAARALVGEGEESHITTSEPAVQLREVQENLPVTSVAWYGLSSLRQRGKGGISALLSRPYFAIGFFLLAALFTVLVSKWWHNREISATTSAHRIQLGVTAPANIAGPQVQLEVKVTESALQAQPVTRHQAVSVDSSDRAARRLVQKALGVEAVTSEDDVKTTLFVTRTPRKTGKDAVPDNSPLPLVSTAQPTSRAGNDLSSALSVPAPLPHLVVAVSQPSAGQKPRHDQRKLRAAMTRLVHRFPDLVKTLRQDPRVDPDAEPQPDRRK